jgi:hypothetical protein
MATRKTELTARSATIGPKRLAGDVVLPRKAKGLVIFAHGRQVGRRSPFAQTAARIETRIRKSGHQHPV